nr:hypothetical protein BaRGS_016024 [Batillaria attramentaria]
MEAFVNSTLGYPRVENGKSIPIPSYDPLMDPHLVEYFERRFGTLQMEELKRQVFIKIKGLKGKLPKTRLTKKAGSVKSNKGVAFRFAKEYEIVTVTGDVMNGGTNANVFLTLFGKTGTTRKIHLKNNTKTLFDRGTTDVFKVRANCVGPMKKVRIEHDNTGIGAGWYLERVVVTDLHNHQWKYFFPCGQWLAKNEGDGAICRDLIASKYKVTVFTGEKRGAGTDANVYITLFGEFGDSGEKKLTKKLRNNFERGRQDEFLLECPKLGRLERVRIGHDNSGFGPGWFLDKGHTA